MTRQERARILRHLKNKKRTPDELEVFAIFFRMIDRLADKQTTKTKG